MRTCLLACNPLWTPEQALNQACVRSRSWAAEGAVQNVAQEVILGHTFLRHCICQDAERAELLTLHSRHNVSASMLIRQNLGANLRVQVCGKLKSMQCVGQKLESGNKVS